MFPSLADFIPKGMDSIHITQHRKIVLVSNDYGSEPAPHLRNRIVHPLSDLTPGKIRCQVLTCDIKLACIGYHIQLVGAFGGPGLLGDALD